MKTNGHMFRDALKRWELRKESAAKRFPGSLLKFAEDTKVTPQAIITEILRCEDVIARLQVGQTMFNLGVMVKVGSGSEAKVMSLTEAVKRVGGAGRIEKFWRVAATETDLNPYGQHMRTTDQVLSQRTVSVEEAVELAVSATGYAESLRAAINRGNEAELDVVGLNPSDFE